MQGCRPACADLGSRFGCVMANNENAIEDIVKHFGSNAYLLVYILC